MTIALGDSRDSRFLSTFTPIPGVLLTPARVVKVILSDEDENFKRLGEWASIGTIEFEFVSQTSVDKVQLQSALPLYPNLKQFPVENEIVLILPATNTGLTNGDIIGSVGYYYLPPINIWTSNHHNAVPDPYFSGETVPKSMQKDYRQTQVGSVRKVTDGSTEIKFGHGFKEKLDIQPLQPIAGDLITEGRWGNSIRLSSTNDVMANPWSKTGAIGSPITLIRNGQTKTGAGWKTNFEDVNTDAASIYLTDTQQINIETNFATDSFYGKKAPEVPNKFSGRQIILASDRLLLNSRKDSILLLSNNSVHLSATNVNIDTTENTVIASSKVYLGSAEPLLVQPAMKGRTTEKLLSDILTYLQQLNVALSAANAMGAPVVSLNGFATANQAFIGALSTMGITSEDVFLT